MKKWLTLVVYFFCFPCFAFAPVKDKTVLAPANCSAVDPWPATNIAVYCAQFEEAAYCHCSQSYSYKYCKNTLKMTGIYKAMLAMYHSIEGACHVAHGEVDEPTCNAQWKFYLASCTMP